jgi:hypothetical protein
VLYPGTLRRLRGYLAFVSHLQRFCGRVAAHLAAVDRERGLYGAPAREFRSISAAFTRGRMLRIFSPFYAPARLGTPAAIEAALLAYESR